MVKIQYMVKENIVKDKSKENIVKDKSKENIEDKSKENIPTSSGG
jgi:hypothetical protein